MNNLSVTGIVKFVESKAANNSTTTKILLEVKEYSSAKYTDTLSVVFWDKLAEIVGKYVKVGRKIEVIGAVKVRTYTNNEGKEVTMYYVRGRDFGFLDAPKKDTESEDTTKVTMKPVETKPVDKEVYPF